MASIYDLLGIISLCHVLWKVIHSELYEEKIPGMQKLLNHSSWDTSSWKNEPVALNKESIAAVDCHVFGDTSIVAGCTVAYAVVDQPSDSCTPGQNIWNKME